jgi:hypothetical protein
MESQSRCLSLSLTPSEAELLRGVLGFFKGLSENLREGTLNRQVEVEGLLVKLSGLPKEKAVSFPSVRQESRKEGPVSGSGGLLFSKEELLEVL